MSIEVDWDIVSELADHLVIRDDKEFSEYTDAEKVFYYSYIFMLEVENGGIHQFLFNYSGDRTKETLDSLHQARFSDSTRMLMKAISLFPSSEVPVNTKDRRNLLDRISIDKLRELDDLFYATSDDFDSALLIFIEKNMRQSVLTVTLSSAITKADSEFRNKNFNSVIDILEPYEECLSPSKLTKLKVARKKSAASKSS